MKLEKYIFKITDRVYGYISMRQSFYCLIDDDGFLILIDCGYKKNFEHNIKKLLYWMNKNITDIKCILVTHADGDHIGGIDFLKNKINDLQIFSSQKTKEYVDSSVMPRHYGFLNFILSYFYKIFFKNFFLDNLIKSGNLLNFLGGIRVVDTPGHTDDHLSYFLEKDAILFSGDIFTVLNGHIKKSPTIFNYDDESLRESIELVNQLNYDVVCPGHGDNFWTNK